MPRRTPPARTLLLLAALALVVAGQPEQTAQAATQPGSGQALAPTPPATATAKPASGPAAQAGQPAQLTPGAAVGQGAGAAPAPNAPQIVAAMGAEGPIAAPGFGVPPFDAWLKVNAYWPRRSTERNAMAAGVMRRGDRLRVIGCAPRCDSKRAVAVIEGGAVVPMRMLAPPPIPIEVQRATDFDGRVGARVMAYRAKVYARPSLSSKVLRKERQGYLVTFVPNPEAPEGWGQRPEGGWMPLKGLKIHKPSTFQGVDSPVLPMMFVHSRVRASEMQGGPGVEERRSLLERSKKRRGKPADPEAIAALAALALPRYHHAEVAAVRGGKVVLADGTAVPKWKVRIAWLRKRPREIPADATWVHLDIEQQAMVVYRGDTPLRATLISTGKKGRHTETEIGSFRALSKVRLSNMAGRLPEPYLAEGVPFVMHFFQGQAFHAAWWHDGFGERRSHGCINLPPLDARWLYENIAPKVPDGWRGLLLGGNDPRLHVIIDKKTPSGALAERPPAAPKPERVRRCVERPGQGSVECPFDDFDGMDPDDPEATR